VGNENWFFNVSGVARLNTNSSDYFSISTPDITVKDQTGQPLEGIRTERDPAAFQKNPKLLDLLERSRTFNYSSGTIELPVTNPPAEVKRTAYGLLPAYIPIYTVKP